MAITINADFDSLLVTIEQIGKKAIDHASRRMGSEAEKIRDLAREYAPLEFGGLEKAIIVESDKSGMNGRKVFYVLINENAPELDEHGSPTGRTVGRYAGYMHEGSYNLGKRSQAKDMGSGKVGPKFLERAADERADEVEKSVYNAVKELL